MDRKIAIRKQRWLDFLDLTSPQRLVFLIRYAPELPTRPLPDPQRKHERVEWIWQNYNYHLDRIRWLDDDTLPCLDMLGGTEIFAEAFGCPIYRSPDNMPFAMPFVHSANEAARLKIPTLDAPPLALAFEMADDLYRRAGPGALFRLVDLQSPMDVAALIWEKTDFFTALVDHPDVVLALVEKIRRLQFAFLDEWFRRYGHEFVAHFPDYYLPEGVSLSVDEIGSVSAKMFVQYFLPDLIQFSQHYGALGVHCCAHARHQWAHFKQVPNLRLLNLCQPGDTLQSAYPFFKEVSAQWHFDQSLHPKNPSTWLQELPSDIHFCIELIAESRDDALRLSDRYRGFGV